MKKMNNKILMIFAILLIFACQASANSVWLDSVSVIPNQPSNTDLITFSISGRAAQTSSWIASDLFSQNGTALQLDLYVDMGAGGTMSYWYFSKQIQPLVQGIYSLEVRAFDGMFGSPFYNTIQDTENTSFTVTPEPATIFLLGLGVLLARKRPVR